MKMVFVVVVFDLLITMRSAKNERALPANVLKQTETPGFRYLYHLNMQSYSAVPKVPACSDNPIESEIVITSLTTSSVLICFLIVRIKNGMTSRDSYTSSTAIIGVCLDTFSKL
jgi:hypothetical protein